MTKSEALRELESMGTEQYRKTYQRHGAKGGVFGVSYASLEMLRKRIGIDHSLAINLWATGNHDARVLANMIADPNAMSAKELDRWIAEIDNHMLSESMTSMMLRSTEARAHADRWIDSPREWVCATGWQVFGGLAGTDQEFPTEYLLRRLAQIQNSIQRAQNRVRHAMVLALIGIGTRGPTFEQAAVAAACMIGPVHVNHGETNCVTPDPIPYLRRIAAHRARSLAATVIEPKKKASAPRPRPSASKIDGKGAAGTDAAAKSSGSNEHAATKTTPRKPMKGSAGTDVRLAKKPAADSKPIPAEAAKSAKSDARKSTKAVASDIRKPAKTPISDARMAKQESASRPGSSKQRATVRAGKAAKKSGPSPAKTEKKPSTTGRAVGTSAAAARTKKKIPARAAGGAKGSRRSASPARGRSGARSSR